MPTRYHRRVRLDQRLRALRPDLSWSRLRAAIEKGQVLVDGRVERDPGAEVADDARPELDLNRRAVARRAARLDLPRLYEDAHVLVVNKPAGLLTIPTARAAAGVQDTVLGRVREYARHARGRAAYAGVLHRLDRDTSGALAVALTREAHAAGRALFTAHAFERTYLALVHGVPEPDRGTIRARVSADYRSGRRAIVGTEAPGRDAVTHYRVKERFDGAALVELRLETGRQHQIRLHLERLGHPLVGEQVYTGNAGGEPRSARAARQMLHAATLAFPHPVTGARVEAAAPLPQDFVTALARLRREYHSRP
ncbi:MAG: RluA family pseudouridine synthase [Acidobacteriota bacterium]